MDQHTSCVSPAVSRGAGAPPHLNLLEMVFFTQPRMLAATFAVRVDYWLMGSLMSTTTPRNFSAKLLSTQSAPKVHWCMGLSLPSCRTWPLAELREVSLSLFLQPVPLNSGMTSGAWPTLPRFLSAVDVLTASQCPGH